MKQPLKVPQDWRCPPASAFHVGMIWGLQIPRPIANVPKDATSIGYTFEPGELALANVRFDDRLETWTLAMIDEAWALVRCERIKFFETRT